MGEGLLDRALRKWGGRSGRSGEQATWIPVDRIDPSPFQPRQHLSEEELEELARSIREVGLLQPIVVRPAGDRYQIVAGERRWRAAQRAGWRAVPALVRPMDDASAALAALVENLQRSDLSFWEEAAAYRRAMTELGLTQEQLAAAIGKSQPTVANKLRLLRLPEDVQEAARAAGLSERHVRALLRLSDPELQREAVRLMAEGEMSAREAEELVSALERGERSSASRSAARRRASLRMIGDVRLLLNTLRQGVEALQRAGLEARMETRVNEDCIEVRLVIPRR